jgi:hypothetical protein
MLLLDRCIFSQKFSFRKYYDIFERARNVKNAKDPGKEVLQGERIVGKEQIIFIFEQIAQELYSVKGNHQIKN